LQVERLQRLLNYPASVFHPLVVLVGHKGAKTRLPENVIAPEKLLGLLRRKSGQLLNAEQAERAIRTIDQARLAGSGAWRLKPLSAVRLLLLLALVAGVYLAFRDDIEDWVAAARLRAEQRSAPEQFRADGSRKSERELWEDSLVCAYSVDTGRCACYEPDGKTADLAPETCRSLAEKGSVLKQ